MSLDDYEQGSWTPVASSGPRGPTGVTYSGKTATYTKCGKLVLATISVCATPRGK